MWQSSSLKRKNYVHCLCAGSRRQNFFVLKWLQSVVSFDKWNFFKGFILPHTVLNICLKLECAQVLMVVFVLLSRVPFECGLGLVFLSSDSLVFPPGLCQKDWSQIYSNVCSCLYFFAGEDFPQGFETLEQMILYLFFQKFGEFYNASNLLHFFFSFRICLHSCCSLAVTECQHHSIVSIFGHGEQKFCIYIRQFFVS